MAKDQTEPQVDVRADAPTEAETLVQLRKTLDEKDALIAELREELDMLRHQSWNSDACGDDFW